MFKPFFTLFHIITQRWKHFSHIFGDLKRRGGTQAIKEVSVYCFNI